MRNNIVHSGAEELTYEIRGIVTDAEMFESFGIKIFWENIGDPVAKGETIPTWIKEIVKQEIEFDKSFAYCPTKGLLATREFLAAQRNQNGGARITPDDILFFNGLGDAISKVYTSLHRDARVMGPSPAYSTHSSAEAAHAGSPHITYNLLPQHNWLPDLDDLKNKVRYNPAISGILIINPDNPTGMVYPRKVLEEIIAIAKEYDLFIVSDEIYSNISYGNEKMTPIAGVIDGIPAIAMRGISKEFPWPGARCGWIEIYNKENDPVFAKYIKSIVDAKMLEVCSTTLPQAVIPKIMSDPRYTEHLKEKNAQYSKRAEIAHTILKNAQGIIAPKPAGAFYMSVVFEDGVLNEKQTLAIANEKAKKFVEEKVSGFLPDKRFVYYLMAATGICVVPLSGFNSSLSGFRITLLESDEAKFKTIFETVAGKIKEYLASA